MVDKSYHLMTFADPCCCSNICKLYITCITYMPRTDYQDHLSIEVHVQKTSIGKVGPNVQGLLMRMDVCDTSMLMKGVHFK